MPDPDLDSSDTRRVPVSAELRGSCGSCNCVCPCACGCPSCGCAPTTTAAKLYSVTVSRTEQFVFRLHAASLEDALDQWQRRGVVIRSQVTDVTVLHSGEVPSD